MRDNEIIKAIECCLSDEPMPCQQHCPFVEKCRGGECLDTYAIDLFNRQKAEIENYRHNNQKLVVENLQMIKSIKHLKAEAIKEFAERLKDKSSKISLVCSGALVKTDYTIAGTDLDNLVKEMVGDHNDQ